MTLGVAAVGMCGCVWVPWKTKEKKSTTCRCRILSSPWIFRTSPSTRPSSTWVRQKFTGRWRALGGVGTPLAGGARGGGCQSVSECWAGLGWLDGHQQVRSKCTKTLNLCAP